MTHHCAIVVQVLVKKLTIDRPHYFQWSTVVTLRYTKIEHMLLVRKTGKGNSAVVLALGILMGKITLSLVSLA